MKTIENPRRAAVLIPLYKCILDESEIFSLHNTAKVLAGHDVYLVGPRKLENDLIKLIAESGLTLRLKLFPNKFFASVAGYNKLLMGRNFYQSFSNYEYVLIAQTDALVFSDQLNEWCDTQYSYLGAPWFRGFAQPMKPIEFLGVGNGGFSLRKVSDFLKVLKYPRRISSSFQRTYRGTRLVRHVKNHIDKWFFSYSFRPLMPRTNEDIFWGLLVPENFSFFTVPTFGESMSFAFEVEPELLYEMNGRRLPFGCHAWEKYDLKFWKYVLPQHGFQMRH